MLYGVRLPVGSGPFQTRSCRLRLGGQDRYAASGKMGIAMISNLRRKVFPDSTFRIRLTGVAHSRLLSFFKLPYLASRYEQGRLTSVPETPSDADGSPIPGNVRTSNGAAVFPGAGQGRHCSPHTPGTDRSAPGTQQHSDVSLHPRLAAAAIAPALARPPGTVQRRMPNPVHLICSWRRMAASPEG